MTFESEILRRVARVKDLGDVPGLGDRLAQHAERGAVPVRHAVVAGEDEGRVLVDAHVLGRLDEPSQVPVLLLHDGAHVRALRALFVRDLVGIRPVNRQHVGDLGDSHELPARVDRPPEEDVDRHAHSVAEVPARLDVEVGGVAIGGTAVLDHVPLHRGEGASRLLGRVPRRSSRPPARGSARSPVAVGRRPRQHSRGAPGRRRWTWNPGRGWRTSCMCSARSTGCRSWPGS